MARPKDLGLEHTWRLRLRRQATGGLSIPEFCRARGGLHRLVLRLEATARRAAGRRPHPTRPCSSRSASIPRSVPDDTPPALGFEIELPHRIRLRCAAAPDPVWLGRLVAALAGSHAAGGRPMISLPSAVRAFFCTRSVDMRKSFDGLSGLVEECFRQDLLDGHLFLFVNRRRDRIKALYFDHDGLAIWYKRLEVGCFQVPDAGDRDGIELDPAQLAMILSGIDLKAARRRRRFRPAGLHPPEKPGRFIRKGFA